MNLNKIIKKPELVYTPPSVIEDTPISKIEYVPTVQNLVDISKSSVVSIQEELKEWEDLTSNIKFTQSDVIQYKDIVVTPQTLTSSLNEVKTEWPTQSQVWLEHNYSSNGIYEKLIYPAIESTKYILRQSIENIWSSSSSGGILQEVLDAELHKLNSAKDLRTKIQKDQEELKNLIDQCMLHTLVKVAIPRTNDLSKTLNTLKTLKDIYRLTKLQNKIKWNGLGKSLSNLVLKTIVENISQQIISNLSQIENQVITPAVNSLEQLESLSNNYLCNSFDKFINKTLSGVYEVRKYYIDILLDYQSKISQMFNSKIDFVEFAKQKVILDKYEILMDELIQILETLSVTGEIGQDIEKYLTSKVFK